MTQAFNLSQFANKLNTSGAVDNTGLQNSSVTVTAGTGLTGGGAVALGSSVTISDANSGVSAGSYTNANITVNALGKITAASSGASGVTSVATGNGLSGGTITSTGTLTIACPSSNTVGSYCFAQNRRTYPGSGGALSSCAFGSDYAAGNGQLQIQLSGIDGDGGTFNQLTSGSPASISGTWRWLGQQKTGIISDVYVQGIACRVS